MCLCIIYTCVYIYIYIISLIIHEEKTKEIIAMKEVVYEIQNPPDLHKLFVRFSQPKSFNIFRIFDEYERLHAFGSHTIYNMSSRVVSDIQSLACGSSLYIRYNMAAHVVNTKYIYIYI